MSHHPSLCHRARPAPIAGVVVAVVCAAAIIGRLVHDEPRTAASPRIDFRHVGTLAWSIEVDGDLPGGLRDVTCTNVRGRRYRCEGSDEMGARRVLEVQVSPGGDAWQTTGDRPE